MACTHKKNYKLLRILNYNTVDYNYLLSDLQMDVTCMYAHEWHLDKLFSLISMYNIHINAKSLTA